MRSGACLSDALVRTGESDAAAFREVYEHTSIKLGGICLRICGNRHSEQDVLQEVYLTVWQRASSYRPERGSAIAWLSRIAHNRSIDWVRHEAQRRSAPIGDADDVEDDRPVAEKELLDREALRRSLHHLERLPGDCRDAITAAFFGRVTYAALAEAHGIPIGTIKSRIRRGLLMLRKEMDA